MTTTSVTCEIRLAAAIQYLACARGAFTPETAAVLFSTSRRKKERLVTAEEAEKEKSRETRECASDLFVRSCFISVEGRVLVLSLSEEEACSELVLLCAGACVAEG